MNHESKLLTLKDWVSIQKLASHVKLSRNYVNQILKGQMKVSAERATEIAHACNMFTHRIDLYKASDFCDDVPKTSAETERGQLIDLIVSSIATLDDLNSQADENATPTLKSFDTIKELSDRVNSLRGVEL
jgi:transcriptional regulator with XRE-family HTH domain